MRIPAKLAAVSVVLVAAPLAACSSGSAASSTAGPAGGSASSPATSPPGASAASDINACTLLSRARASALVGKHFIATVSRTIAAGQDQCTYQTSGDSEAMDVIIYQPGSGVNWKVMHAALSDAGAVKSVSGVGDQAMVGAIELDAQAGTRFVAVEGAGGSLTGSDSAAVAVVRAVISGLH